MLSIAILATHYNGIHNMSAINPISHILCIAILATHYNGIHNMFAINPISPILCIAVLATCYSGIHNMFAVPDTGHVGQTVDSITVSITST